MTLPASPGPGLAGRYDRVRGATERLCEPLEVEDLVVQTMEDVSPTKWHLAHTSWFFETFVLAPHAQGYRVFDPGYGYLFNSYYQQVGAQFPRGRRGLLSRPGVAEVRRYRAHVDQAMAALLGTGLEPAVAALVELGLNHEQQHQELILTDLAHVLSINPLNPVYLAGAARPEPGAAPALTFHPHPGGRLSIGHAGPGFAFDHEGPRHALLVRPFELGGRLATTAEYLAFMADGGYERPELWLSDGWNQVQRDGWRAPLYWTTGEEGWRVFTLGGLRAPDPAEPVCHVSYYEADAFARWSGARLPSEAEWELFAAEQPVLGNFAERGVLHPLPAPAGPGPVQLFGDAWEWTASAYAPYPGYRPAPGAVGEYNGKFMVNQLVLRGGSCVTPGDHVRATYRNFFPAQARWQFTGIRLARELDQ